MASAIPIDPHGSLTDLSCPLPAKLIIDFLLAYMMLLDTLRETLIPLQSIMDDSSRQGGNDKKKEEESRR